MAFPLHGGLVESCHTAAENTHPALGLFMKVVNPTFASLLSALVESRSNCSILFQLQKEEEKKLFIVKKIRNHVFHKLLALSSHSHSNHVHRVLVKRERALLKPHRLMAC